ncbi:PREDICTED: cystatin-11 [Condylura cristata]|uniref:cystatin-11 n=1 Tax=Condylura cristata TaxID=143302 RepID=UPI0003347CB2|nr:PREDICTED: cystatin-11 [Condylura cristata]
MARSQKRPQLLLAILVVLVTVTYQAGKKTFISIQEISMSEFYVSATMQFVTSQFNKESDDQYNFRIVRILKILKKVTDHLEYHVNLEMRRTTCQKLEMTNCTFQEGELYKQINCYFSVYAIPWFERYKILNKTCHDG